jgi:hypothetical protein
MKLHAAEDRERLITYLKSLNAEELDELLKQVLIECRSRETEQIKADILSHSQELRLRPKP